MRVQETDVGLFVRPTQYLRMTQEDSPSTLRSATDKVDGVFGHTRYSDALIDGDQPGADVGSISLQHSEHGGELPWSVSDPRFEVLNGRLKLKDGISLDRQADTDVNVVVSASWLNGLETFQIFRIRVKQQFAYSRQAGNVFLDATAIAGISTIIFSDLAFADLTISRIIDPVEDEAVIVFTWTDGSEQGAFHVAEEANRVSSYQFSDGIILDPAALEAAIVDGPDGLSDHADQSFSTDDARQNESAFEKDPHAAGRDGDNVYKITASSDNDNNSGSRTLVLDGQADNGSSGNYDRVVFVNLNAADIVASRREGGDSGNGNGNDSDELVLSWQGGELVLANEGQSIETFEFADGRTVQMIEIADAPLIEGTSMNDWLVGGKGSNRLVGDAPGADHQNPNGRRGGDDILEGGRGNDDLWGDFSGFSASYYNGDDLFLFRDSFGHDVIHDFTAGADSVDTILFSIGAGFTDFDDLQAWAEDDGVDTTIIFDDDNSIVLKNVLVTDLTADDFEFV